MLVRDVINFLDDYAPLVYSEDFDNTGLIVGDKNEKVTGIIICLDSTKEVIEEAIESKSNLIISFHPIIFNGLKQLSTGNYVNDSIILAIKNNISVFAIHTALDNSNIGVSMKLCEVLGISNKKVLIPKTKTIKKLTTYIPKNDAIFLKNKLFSVGAGSIGKYDNCSFSFEGEGTFKGNEISNPTIGDKLKDTIQNEVCINITFLKHLEEKVLCALKEVHPYEEIAYEITTLENFNENIGMGMYGETSAPISERKFFELLKNKLGTSFLKHSKLLNKDINKVAVLAGSGSFGIEMAISVKADVYVTADLKYHDYFKAENSILLVDVGHYESEQFTKYLLYDILTKKFPNFEIALAKTNTNPVKYS
tara:strand:+ start:3508 stop:4602 length:1095 start_codon:yes stop_codon:yes gene_type:complete